MIIESKNWRDKMTKYDFIGSIRIVYSLILTKLFYKKARLIRQPFDIRGKKYIEIGEKFTTGVGCRLEAYPNDTRKILKIGKNVQINDYVHIAARESVVIEDNVLIASKVFITDLNHGIYDENIESDLKIIPKERALSSKPVKIEKNVWIGESVSILPGVKIGENSIVGAGSVVTKSFPKNVIVAGNPAKILKVYKNGKWRKV